VTERGGTAGIGIFGWMNYLLHCVQECILSLCIWCSIGSAVGQKSCKGALKGDACDKSILREDVYIG